MYAFFVKTLDYVGIATSAAVPVLSVVIALFALPIILFLTYLYYQHKQSHIIIRFSNPDKPGSLAKMLKVFKVTCIIKCWLLYNTL